MTGPRDTANISLTSN